MTNLSKYYNYYVDTNYIQVMASQIPSNFHASSIRSRVRVLLNDDEANKLYISDQTAYDFVNVWVNLFLSTVLNGDSDSNIRTAIRAFFEYRYKYQLDNQSIYSSVTLNTGILDTHKTKKRIQRFNYYDLMLDNRQIAKLIIQISGQTSSVEIRRTALERRYAGAEPSSPSANMAFANVAVNKALLHLADKFGKLDGSMIHAAVAQYFFLSSQDDYANTIRKSSVDVLNEFTNAYHHRGGDEWQFKGGDYEVDVKPTSTRDDRSQRYKEREGVYTFLEQFYSLSLHEGGLDGKIMDIINNKGEQKMTKKINTLVVKTAADIKAQVSIEHRDDVIEGVAKIIRDADAAILKRDNIIARRQNEKKLITTVVSKVTKLFDAGKLTVDLAIEAARKIRKIEDETYSDNSNNATFDEVTF